jgi:hypothetical protein
MCGPIGRVGRHSRVTRDYVEAVQPELLLRDVVEKDVDAGSADDLDVEHDAIRDPESRAIDPRADARGLDPRGGLRRGPL